MSLMFLTLMVTAQKYYTYEVNYGKWNEIKKDYDYGPPIKKIMELNFNGDIVDITDRTRSTYKVFNIHTITDSDKSFADKWNGIWDAIDEQNKKCKIICRVYSKSKEAKFVVSYDDVVFHYFIKID